MSVGVPINKAVADGVLEVVEVQRDRREAAADGHVVQEVAGDRDQVEEDLAAPEVEVEVEAGHRDLEVQVGADVEALEVVGVHRGLEARVVVDVCGGSSEQCLL